MSARQAAQCRSLPMRALLDRLGSGAQAMPWFSYLPADLLPTEPNQGKVEVALGRSSGSCLDKMVIGGRVWSLSQEAFGCRQVQAALEDAESNQTREALAGELRGHVLQAAKCPHANHVLQKCIALLMPGALQFVVDELLLGSVGQTARHKYGCRVVQRLVEHCPAGQVHCLVECLVPEVGALSRHAYGNYVVQILLQHGTDDQRRRMAGALAKEIRFLGSESCGCAVVTAALTYAPDAERRALAKSLLGEPGLLVFMACTRHGYTAVLHVLRLLEGAELEEARRRLQSEAGALRVSRYGRLVVEQLEAFDSQLLSLAISGGA